VIGEPSGWDAVTIGYKGRLTLDITLSREARHGASPGPTIAEEALAVWDRVRESASARANATRSFERLDCRLEGIDAGVGDGLVERAKLRIGYRVPPGVDPGDLEAAAARLVKSESDIRFVVSTQGREEPVRTPRTTPLARAFARAISAAGGQTSFKEKSGTSDMNVLFPAWRCPMVAYGAGDSRYDHTPIERLSISDFARSITVLKGLLSRASDRII
jgi:LysW-gamma-L-lysine carboxypeptidase